MQPLLTTNEEQALLEHLLEAFKLISSLLRYSDTSDVSSNYHDGSKTQNSFGDVQLKIDLETDKIIFEHLQYSNLVREAASEESPKPKTFNEDGPFSVGFDPLDGSSIVDANISVGSIVGVWRAPQILGQAVKDQVFSCYAIYGFRTACVVAFKDGKGKKRCVELSLNKDGGWTFKGDIQLQPIAKGFSPGNIRATNDNDAYKSMIIDGYIAKGLTLRYFGGLVPEIHHMLVKGQGIHSNIHSDKHKAKLRLLFEVGPLSYLVDCAGGASFTWNGNKVEDVMDLDITSYEERLSLVIGSSLSVSEARKLFLATSELK